MKPIGMNDFRAQWSRDREAVLAAVERVGASGWWILGAEVEHFEAALAARWGLPHAIGCGSGLDAIEIALRAAGLAPGELVLTTPLSAFATCLAILRAGGRPVFADVDRSGQLDLAQCADLLETRPEIRFLVPVHLYGHALDPDALTALRDRFDLTVIEDCAQAIGARHRGRPVGTVGAAAATSFYPTKNLGALGDAGALLTADEAIAARARALRDYGQTARFEHALPGLNSRLDELHAAILRTALLPRLEDATRRRREIAARYRADLEGGVELVPVPDGSESVWHLFPLLVDERETLRDHLERAGVASGVHYPFVIPEQPALGRPLDETLLAPIPNARAFAARELSLPIHPLLSDEEVERVIAACNEWRLRCTPS